MHPMAVALPLVCNLVFIDKNELVVEAPPNHSFISESEEKDVNFGNVANRQCCVLILSEREDPMDG